MILSTLTDFHRYAGLHPRFQELSELLTRLEPGTWPEGRTELDGEAIYVMAVPEARTRPHAPLEAHRRYIDVQVVLEGLETMGWAPLAACPTVREPYDPAGDIVFFEEPPLAQFPVPAGHLAVFFPEDAHVPLLGNGERVSKLIFKVRVD